MKMMVKPCTVSAKIMKGKLGTRLRDSDQDLKEANVGTVNQIYNTETTMGDKTGIKE